MEKYYNKLSENEKKKFLIKKILENDFFDDVHDEFELNYGEIIYQDDDKKLQEIKNLKYVKELEDELENYLKHATEMMANLSRYKVTYDTVKYSKNRIEKIAEDNKINLIDKNDNSVVDLICYCWEMDCCAIRNLPDELTLKNAIKKLFDNPNVNSENRKTLDDEFGEYKDYQVQHSHFSPEFKYDDSSDDSDTESISTDTSGSSNFSNSTKTSNSESLIDLNKYKQGGCGLADILNNNDDNSDNNSEKSMVSAKIFATPEVLRSLMLKMNNSSDKDIVLKDKEIEIKDREITIKNKEIEILKLTIELQKLKNN